MTACNDQPTMELKVGTVKYFKDIERDNLGLPMYRQDSGGRKIAVWRFALEVVPVIW